MISRVFAHILCPACAASDWQAEEAAVRGREIYLNLALHKADDRGTVLPSSGGVEGEGPGYHHFSFSEGEVRHLHV